MRNAWVAIVVAGAAGTVFGFWLRGMGESGRAEPATVPAAASAAKPTEPLPASPLPATVLAPREKEENARESNGLAALRSMQALQKQGLLDLHVNIFESGHRLSPRIKALLNINEAEAAQLERTAADIDRRINEYEAGVAVAQTNPETGDIVISVPSYPEQGGKFFDEVMAQFGAVLGPERNAAFLQLAETQLEQKFSGFGVQDRVMTVHRPGGENAYYRVRNEREQRIPGADGAPQNQRWNSEGSFGSREDIVKHFGGLAEKFVPRDF